MLVELSDGGRHEDHRPLGCEPLPYHRVRPHRAERLYSAHSLIEMERACAGQSVSKPRAIHPAPNVSGMVGCDDGIGAPPPEASPSGVSIPTESHHFSITNRETAPDRKVMELPALNAAGTPHRTAGTTGRRRAGCPQKARRARNRPVFRRRHPAQQAPCRRRSSPDPAIVERRSSLAGRIVGHMSVPTTAARARPPTAFGAASACTWRPTRHRGPTGACSPARTADRCCGAS